MSYFVSGLGAIAIIVTVVLIVIMFLRDAKVFKEDKARVSARYLAAFVLIWTTIVFMRFWRLNAMRGAVSMFDFFNIYYPRLALTGIATDMLIAVAFLLAASFVSAYKVPRPQTWMVFVVAFVSRPVLLLAGLHFSGVYTFERLLYRLAVSGDAVHYLNIAQNFYAAYGQPYANEIVFYPLFPMLMRAVAFLPGVSLTGAGIIVSWVSFGFAAVALYKICKQHLFPVLLLCFAPFGVFFGVLSTESLFIAFTLYSMYMAIRRKWLFAGVLGFFAALTKTQGVLVFGFFLYEYGLWCMEDADNIKAGLKKVQANILYSLIIPFGLFLYLFLNRIVQGHWFIFLDHQAAPPWWNSADWVGNNLAQQWNMGVGFGLGAIIYFVQIAAFFVVFGLLIYSLLNRQRMSFIVYGFAYMFTSFTHGWLISGPRYITSCVAMYILANQIKSPIIRYALVAASFVMAVFFTRLYLDGHSIM